MSETPLTDQWQEDNDHAGCEAVGWARELELKLAAMKNAEALSAMTAERDNWKAAYDGLVHLDVSQELKAVTAQRDAWRDRVEVVDKQLDNLSEECMAVTTERDAIKARLETCFAALTKHCFNRVWPYCYAYAMRDTKCTLDNCPLVKE